MSESNADLLYRPFRLADEAAVRTLWDRCELTRPWNDPAKDMRRKLDVQAEHFYLVLDGERPVGSVMAGYDGHRGSIYYLAVDPDYQRRGIGRKLMQMAEKALLALGCPKVNLQVRTGNTAVLDFYETIGYKRDEVVGLGRRLIVDDPELPAPTNRDVASETSLPSAADAEPDGSEPVAVTRDSVVSLREIDDDNLRAFLRLQVRADQKRFVADNSISIAQAHFSEHAWFRGVCADETPVGFLMLHDEPEKPEYFLWRFMIDHRFQRFGYGGRALGLLIDHVKTRPGATSLETSAVPGNGSPQAFYEKNGFRPTGEVDEGEVVLRLSLEE